MPRVVFGLQGLQQHGVQQQGFLPDAALDASLSFVRAMAAHRRDMVAGLSVDPQSDASWLTRLLPAGLPILSAKEVQAIDGPLVFHVLSLLSGRGAQQLWPAWARPATVALAVSVHDDLTRLALESSSDTPEGRLNQSRHRLIRRADAVIATSHAGALDAIGWGHATPEKVFVAHETVDNPCSAVSEGSAPRIDGFNAAGDFVVSPACASSSMHTENIVRTFTGLASQLPGDPQLVLVAKQGRTFAPNYIADLDGDSRPPVIVATGLELSELRWLYRSCLVTVIGGVDNGSAAAAIEAAAHGSGVVAADHDALLELIPEPDARFYPTSMDSISSVLRRCLTDGEFCRARREETARAFAGYSEEGAAEALTFAYRRAAAGRPRRRLPESAASL